ncbi:MAG TPA: hypothetical protein VFP36_04490 [Usitatibacter sp.]|nr:hypothetical protein [Usitatibacter sp.]
MGLIVRSTVFPPRCGGEKYLVVASARDLENGRCVTQHSVWAEDLAEAALKCCQLARLTREHASQTTDVHSVYCTHCPTPVRRDRGRCLG